MTGETLNIVQDQLEKLKQIFPETITEGKIDWEKLQSTLGKENIEFSNERYVLNWAGKSEAFKVLQQTTTATLKPVPEESINFDTTENVFIEGENLEVLKVLQKSYYGKVKVVCIDPPYNTGNDSFIYPDSFKESKEEYQKRIGEKDEEGFLMKEGFFRKNSKDSGHYHSNWLSMMYPRLFLAKNLLREDGVIFVHIDDNEVHNLRMIMNEIFGEENFLVQFIWASEGNTDNQFAVKVKHEYILAYLKNKANLDKAIGRIVDPNTRKDSNLWKGFSDNNINKNNPENPPTIVELPIGFPADVEELLYRKKNVDDAFFEITNKEKFISDTVKARYHIENLSGLPIKLDDLEIHDFKLSKSCRIYGGFANSNKLKTFIENGLHPIKDDDGAPISFYLNRNAAVRYRKEVDRPSNILSVLQNLGTTEKNKTELKRIGIEFSYPKPVGLIKYLISIGAQYPDSIILDFFAGSATTAQATFELNLEDKGSRSFICVQLPEFTENDSEAFKKGYKTISDIGKERIRRVSKELQIKKLKPDLFDNKRIDLGFKVFKLSSSNFKIWRGSDITEDNLEQQLELFTDPVREGSEKENMLYELILKAGYLLTDEIKAKDSYYSVNEGELIIALEEMNQKLIETIISAKPKKVITLDQLFSGNDQLKTNAVLQMKDAEIDFKTI